MRVRESLFAAAVAVGFGLIVAGISDVHRAAGLVAAGVLLVVWTWLILSGDGDE